MSPLLADTVVKRFSASERRTFFPDQARTGNIDSRISPFRFYYCLFLLIGWLDGDFCNSICQKRTLRSAAKVAFRIVAALVVRGRVDIVPVTLDNASVPSIGRHAATGRVARLLSDGSSVGCGQGRKGGAENDCSGKCDLCHIRHCPISFVCSPPGATASAQVTIRSGSATAEIGCPNRRLKYRLDIVSMPQRYRAALRRFLWIGSRLRNCVAFGVAATS